MTENDRIAPRPTFTGYLIIGAIAVGVLVWEADARVLFVTMFFTEFGVTGMDIGGLRRLSWHLNLTAPEPVAS